MVECGVARILYVTGTDTGAGKTVLSAWIAARRRACGERIAVAKPICSGDRDDAEALRAAAGGASLDAINPWHFTAPLAPLLAARAEGRTVDLRDVMDWLAGVGRGADLLIVEGAGGLLSPLGEGFDNRDLLAALGASPIVVCPNRLGAVGLVRLTLSALPVNALRAAKVVLMNQRTPDSAAASNAALLSEFFDPLRISAMPWLEAPSTIPWPDECGTALDSLAGP